MDIYESKIKKKGESPLTFFFFEEITTYMHNKDLHVETVQFILKTALENSELQDETYCQIIKQTTDNPKKYFSISLFAFLWLSRSICFVFADRPCETVNSKCAGGNCSFSAAERSHLRRDCCRTLRPLF
jgi:hypothetical protein